MKPGILSIDIGGTGLKADVVDDEGNMLGERVRVPTPRPAPPDVVVAAIVEMVADLPAYNRISIGFPGVVRDGKVLTAVNLEPEAWLAYPLADTLSAKLGGHPARLLNDADMQGYALVSGKGVEIAITLGTGFGSALFRDGELMPHMELAHHPFRNGKSYEHYLGDANLKRVGKKRWNAYVLEALHVLFNLLHPDRIYIGGGNTRKLGADLPAFVVVGSNDAGIEGGAALWNMKSKIAAVQTHKLASAAKAGEVESEQASALAATGKVSRSAKVVKPAKVTKARTTTASKKAKPVQTAESVKPAKPVKAARKPDSLDEVKFAKKASSRKSVKAAKKK